MRKFIVSDLHGNGNIYDSIMSYLDNINKIEEIILYINGDLIDRGIDSARMLIDISNRIINNKGFKIKYLAGNHELLNCDEVENIIKFIANLDIYYKFNELIGGKNIVLVHAMCPKIVKDKCDLKLGDNTKEIENLLWTRKNEFWFNMNNNIGNSNYFTIIGHTPVSNSFGYSYDNSDNVLNIDGGCAAYAKGFYEYDHTPLVEIDNKNNRLIILTFNNNNCITYGNYFYDGITYPMNEKKLDGYREFLNKNIKIKQRKIDI